MYLIALNPNILLIHPHSFPECGAQPWTTPASAKFFNQSLAHLYPSPQGNFMNVHFGRYCNAFYYGGSRQGIKSAFCTFGVKCLAHGRCTKLSDAGVSRSSPEKDGKDFRLAGHVVLVATALTILLFCIVAQRQP